MPEPVGADHRDDRRATGSLRPLLSSVIAGSFQLVIWLVKILAIVSPDSRRLRTSLPPTLSWYGERGAAGDDRQVGVRAAVRVSALPVVGPCPGSGDLGDGEVGASCREVLAALGRAAAGVDDLHAVGVDVGDPLVDRVRAPGRAGALDQGVGRRVGGRRPPSGTASDGRRSARRARRERPRVATPRGADGHGGSSARPSVPRERQPRDARTGSSTSDEQHGGGGEGALDCISGSPLRTSE